MTIGLKGGFLGMLFGAVGLMTASIMFGGATRFYRSFGSPEAEVMGAVFFVYAFIFGRKVAKHIEKHPSNASAASAGILSSVATTMCTIPTGYLLLAATEHGLSNFLDGTLMLMAIVFFMGIIPMSIIGAIYGLIIKSLLDLK